MMSVINQVGPPVAGYFKAQAPFLSSVQTGLSIFALFIIARYLVQSVYSWLRPTKRPSPSPFPTSSPSSFYYHHRPPQELYLPRYQPRSWTADEKSSYPWASFRGMTIQSQSHPVDDAAAVSMDASQRPGSNPLPDTIARPFLSRPPPAPPLTPPELSGAVFSLEERRQANHESLIHQPNPDYMSGTSTSSFQADNPDSFIPRRRSYTRSLSMNGRVRQEQPHPALMDVRSGDQTFSPISLAASSEGSHQAPPMAGDSSNHNNNSGSSNENPHRENMHISMPQRNVDVQGEIISVLDREGAGWTRHTRVYGGGACLACAASGGGGFYGATVTPEEMR